MPPEQKDKGLTDNYIVKVMERAAISRFALIVEGLYFVIVGVTLTAAESKFFGSDLLLAKPAFVVAGIVTLATVWKPDKPYMIVLFLITVAGATLGRAITNVLSEDLDFGQKIRSIGWVLPWLLAVVCIIQINLAKVLRRTKLWNG